MSEDIPEVATIGAIVHGNVQGVGFRFFVSRAATRFGVAGWVKNLPDGSVELQATGSREALDRFLNSLSQAPPGSSVSRIEKATVETKETPSDRHGRGGGFRILY